MLGLERWFLLRLRCLLPVLFALLTLTSVGCKAQDPGIPDPALARQVEILIRGQFNIPADMEFKILGGKPSSFPGYDELSVTLSRGGKASEVEFLLSKDNKTLAHLETYDLTNIAGLHIPVDARPIRGNPSAKVTVINFDDLECPYCARMHTQLFPDTLDRYKDKVRFIYKDDPLVEIHPWAMHAAVDSNCIAAQDSRAYWGYVDYLHSHGQEVTGPDRDIAKSYSVLDRIAQEQGRIFKLDAGQLSACIAKQDESAVRSSMHEAEGLGIEGTPSLYIGGEHIYGAVPVEQVWAAIDRALRAVGEAPPPQAMPEPLAVPAGK